MRMQFHAALAGAALVLAGCVAVPRRLPAPLPQPATRFHTPAQALTYHVFMGELALQRGDRRQAVQQYARAAELGSDPTLAEHAVVLAYQAGDDRLALNLSRHWLTLAPKNISARHFEALLNTRLGNVAAAVSEFKSLLRDVPSESFPLIAELLGQETGARQGLPVMRQLVTAYPQSAQAHFALGRLALHYRRAPLAVSEAQRALALRPHWDEALMLEARALVAAHRNDEALKVLKAHVQAAPDNIGLRLAYAALLAQTQENAQARTEFAAVLKRNPHNPDALYSLGLLALQDGHLAEAHGYFMRLLKTGRRNDDAGYFLGNTAELAKRYAEALAWYQRVNGGHYWLSAQLSVVRVLTAQGKPDAARSYMNGIIGEDAADTVQLRIAEAQIFSDMGHNRTALQIFAQALEQDPYNTDLLYARALLQENLGNVAAAESDLRRILSRSPDNADALNALGYTLTVHSTRYQEAFGYIEKALSIRPHDAAIIDSMGWVEYRLGNYQQALGYLRRAYARLADPQVAAHLAEVLWASGDKQEARSVWSAALKRHPGNPALLKVGRRFSP